MGPGLRGDDESICGGGIELRDALQNITGTIVLAGAGKMGGAMLAGWLARGLDSKRVCVIEPHPSDDISALVEKGRSSQSVGKRYRQRRHAGGRAEAADPSAKPALS